MLHLFTSTSDKLKYSPKFLQEADRFGLPESSAILKYLCSSQNVIEDHWYPSKSVRTRATIDAIMAWHASTLRIGSMIVVWNLAIAGNLGIKANKTLVNDYGMPTLKEALKVLDFVWLKNSSNTFLVGNEISIADIQVACEIEQLCLLDGVADAPSMCELLSSFSRVNEWLENVRSVCQPHYDDVHKMLRFVRDRQLSKKSRL